MARVLGSTDPLGVLSPGGVLPRVQAPLSVVNPMRRTRDVVFDSPGVYFIKGGNGSMPLEDVSLTSLFSNPRELVSSSNNITILLLGLAAGALLVWWMKKRS